MCLGHPIVNDPLYNHPVFGPERGEGGRFGRSEDELINELIKIHNADNWVGEEGEVCLDRFNVYSDAHQRTLQNAPGALNNAPLLEQVETCESMIGGGEPGVII